MTNKEAIKVLKKYKRYAESILTNEVLDSIAFDMAIEALSTDAARVLGDMKLQCKNYENYQDISTALKKKQIKKMPSDTVNRKDTVTLNSPISIQAEMMAVVRCKDCQHQEHCHETVAHTKKHDDFNEYWSEPIEWCSRGKRREP